jgi:L-asparaginase/beta-aspartyl-peptidase (threonine type)
MIAYGIVVHGGAGSPGGFSDGCKRACEAGYRLLEGGEPSLDAVAEAVRVLENDGRFNAGRGSALRLDGKTVEMDAAVMDSEGNIGMVMAIRHVQNPVLVARAVVETPHCALAGEGAVGFARARGFEDYYSVSEASRKRYRQVMRCIEEGRLGECAPHWKNMDISRYWNYNDVLKKNTSCDTVGAVAMDRRGVFATASSTGGFSPMMLGRVGDSPLIGCGFYAGNACAVTATGMGEEIIKKMLCRKVYESVSQGISIEEACGVEIDRYPPDIAVGLIGITRKKFAILSNTGMAAYSLVKAAEKK